MVRAVIPAKAGIQFPILGVGQALNRQENWIPAFAGMTSKIENRAAPFQHSIVQIHRRALS
ncbi:MAG TPA: hypothetical protein VHQ21_00250, partial [Rhodanobacteraceae bacterium]|nr:hypothetical protein [Rhodanobacteraceae bacterium]